jgi:mercuric ion transport protein
MRFHGSRSGRSGGHPCLTCCWGPLVLIAIGFSGAWIGNLAKLEPYRPIFIGIALAAMFFGWRAIYRPATECNPGDVCALPQTKRIYKVLFWIVAIPVLIALSCPYLAPLFY